MQFSLDYLARKRFIDSLCLRSLVLLRYALRALTGQSFLSSFGPTRSCKPFTKKFLGSLPILLSFFALNDKIKDTIAPCSVKPTLLDRACNSLTLLARRWDNKNNVFLVISFKELISKGSNFDYHRKFKTISTFQLILLFLVAGLSIIKELHQRHPNCDEYPSH